MTNDGNGEIRMTKLEGLMKSENQVSFQNLVCFLQRLFASDIEPLPLDLERFQRVFACRAIDKAARLIWIVACSEIRRQKERTSGVIVKCDRSQGPEVSAAFPRSE